MTSDDHPATACSAAAAGSYATHVSQRAFDAGLTSLIDGLAAGLPDKAVSSSGIGESQTQFDGIATARIIRKPDLMVRLLIDRRQAT